MSRFGRIGHRISTGVAWVARWLQAVDIRHAAAVLFGAILVVGIVGSLTLRLDPGNAWFDLDSELGLAWPPQRTTVALPALWSALTFALAGACWITVSWLAVKEGIRAASAGLGSYLVFAAADELFIIHERFENRTGLDWQILYLPVAAMVAALLVLLAWRLRQRRDLVLMLGGAGLCWAIAATLEMLQWRGDRKVALYEIMMVPEEMLELAGVALLVLAALSALQSTAVRQISGSATEGYRP
jgi:hypothetical protein